MSNIDINTSKNLKPISIKYQEYTYQIKKKLNKLYKNTILVLIAMIKNS